MGNGVESEQDIKIEGDYTGYDGLDILGEWSEYGGQYPYDLIQEFHPGVTIVRGLEMACREGCVNNPLANFIKLR